MKKIISIILIMITITLSYLCFTFASNTYEIELETVKNSKHKEFELYILLPKEYVEYAVREANLGIEYKGIETLKNNEIPGIAVEKNNIQNTAYTNNGIEYIQILLNKDQNGVYRFDILDSYPKMNMKFRIVNSEKEYIMHIDNFKVDNGKCKIEYNYDENTVKQPDRIVIPKGVMVLIVLLVIIIVIGGISKIKS